MALSGNLEICLKAFARRDYRRCAAHAGAVMRTEGSLHIVQLLLISLQRLDQREELALVTPEILKATATFALDHSLIRLTLGHIDLDEVLDLSSDPMHACQAHYYAGARALTCGDPEAARKYFQRSVSFGANCIESVLAESECGDLGEGVDNPHWQEFSLIEDQATTLYEQGEYEGAIQLAGKALAMCRKVAGENDPRCAVIMSNLASFHIEAGNYGEAERLLVRGADVLRESKGSDDPTYVGSLINLAEVYRHTGRQRETIELYATLLTVLERDDGDDDRTLAFVLNNLGLVYAAIGRLVDAAKVLIRAIDIRREILGSDSELTAASCSNLARVLCEGGVYTEAEPYFREALDIKERVLGDKHPSYAASADGLGLLLLQTGKLEEGEKWIRKALEVNRDTHGPNHGAVASNLNSLAFVRSAMGHFAEAESLLSQALEIRRATSGEDHAAYSNALTNLASMCVFTDRVKRAWELYREAVSIDDRTLVRIVSLGSERQRLEFLATLRGKSDAIMSLACGRRKVEEHAVSTAVDLAFRRKAMEAEVQAVHRDAILEGKYPELRPRLRGLTVLRNRIAQATLASRGLDSPPGHQQQLTELRRKKEQLEAELARSVPETDLEQKLRAADHRAVALSLPEGAALVEFIRFNVFDFKAVAQRVSYTQWVPPRKWKPARYLAFVLRAGKPDNVEMIDLGEGEEIDQLIRDFRAGVSQPPGTRVDGGPAGEAVEAAVLEVGFRLHAALFPDPLRKALGDSRRLLIAPDGDLNQLPFEVLPIGDGKRMIDEYQLSYLSVGRDVLRFGAVSTGQPGPAVVAADPDFDLGLNVADGMAAETGDFRGRKSRGVDRSLGEFKRLPGTREEGEHIARMLGVEPWLDDSVLESRLKGCTSPWILHLATHGFFLEDQKIDLEALGRGMQFVASEAFSQGPGPTAGRLENPLLRSGLALAGVNWTAKGLQPPAEAEDGLLTAEDVTGMDLLATELVVLSACETGRGEIQVGEGVFGLRRSFVLAGGKTLVMSLWSVPDRQTQELMEEFYGSILAGESRAEALRQAQLAMKAKYRHPYYWGAFICQGDPGPLRCRETSET
ncbi:tetratricopeptide repeat protein [Planctomycetota bacterium]